jgi:hypothetical protein
VPREPRTPSYRLHKPSGRAVVTLDGRDLYLGPHQSDASRELYDRLVSEWLRTGRRLPAPADEGVDFVVVELVDAYLAHVQAYYVKEGAPTSEQASINCALRPLLRLYRDTPVTEFGPLKLKTVRQDMILRVRRSWRRS